MVKNLSMGQLFCLFKQSLEIEPLTALPMMIAVGKSVIHRSDHKSVPLPQRVMCANDIEIFI